MAEMSDKEIKETMQEGFGILQMLARNIAMLPLEDWDAAFDKAEAVGAILDPTLYRNYLYSKQAPVIRKLIKAAMTLKAVVVEAQPLAREAVEKRMAEGARLGGTQA